MAEQTNQVINKPSEVGQMMLPSRAIVLRLTEFSSYLFSVPIVKLTFGA